MDRVDVEDFCGADNGGNIEITLRGRRGTDANGFVCKPDVQRIAIDIAVHRDRADAHLFTRPDDATGNLAAVGDENFPKATLSVHSISDLRLPICDWSAARRIDFNRQSEIKNRKCLLLDS